MSDQAADNLRIVDSRTLDAQGAHMTVNRVVRSYNGAGGVSTVTIIVALITLSWDLIRERSTIITADDTGRRVSDADRDAFANRVGTVCTFVGACDEHTDAVFGAMALNMPVLEFRPDTARAVWRYRRPDGYAYYVMSVAQ